MCSSNVDKNVFAERMWALADIRHVTLAEIGRRAGLRKNQIHVYFTKERHQPTLPVIAAIADAMNVSADYLCGLSDDAGEVFITIDDGGDDPG